MPSPRSALPVVLLVVFAGCLGGQPTSDPRAERIVNRSVDALRNVDSYRYDIMGQVRVEANDRAETFDIEGFGAVNATQRRVRTTIAGAGENETAYVDGSTVYVACPRSEYVNVRDAWYPVRTLPENHSWRRSTDLAVGAFLQRVPVEYAGNETVDGDRLHVITADPSVEQFRNLESRLTVSGDEELNRGRLVSVTIQYWVDAETGRPHQLRYLQDRNIEGTTVQIRQTVRFEYRPASVSLPPTVDSKEACPRPS